MLKVHEGVWYQQSSARVECHMSLRAIDKLVLPPRYRDCTCGRVLCLLKSLCGILHHTLIICIAYDVTILMMGHNRVYR